MRDDRSVAFGGDCVMVPMDVGSFDFHAVERAIETLGWSGEVRWACTFFDRLWGFGRSDFSGEGSESCVLVFPHCGSVHTCGMRFDLDIAFADGDGRIAKCVEGVNGWRVVSCPGARFALERRSPVREVSRTSRMTGAKGHRLRGGKGLPKLFSKSCLTEFFNLV